MQSALTAIVVILVSGLCTAQTLSSDSGASSVLSPIAAGGGIVPGRLILRVDPKYPKAARKKKIEGQVVLEATIEPNGSVSGLSVESGDVMLADAAVDVVRDWKFEPYTQNGQPIRVQQNLAFNFVLDRKLAQLEPNLPPPFVTPQPSTSVLGVPRRLPSDGEKPLRVGGAVTAPKAIYTPDPAYNKEARKAKYQGTCLLSMIVGADGRPRDIKVVRALGKDWT
jgi:TonB family protein